MRTPEKYDRVAVVIHWLIAALMIYMVLFGEDLMNRHAADNTGATWHATIGISILALSVLRFFWRLSHTPPALPVTMKRWEITLSHVVHYAFYAGMLLIPLSGWLSYEAFAGKHPALGGASFLGLFQVPMLTIGAGWNWGGLHELLANLMKILIVLHVLAGLKHQFVDKDGLLKRMT